METIQRLELVPINMLVGYARNARTHSPEQIAQLRASLREFGFVNPVLCDKDHTIIAGHGRVEAARAEGVEMVPCVFVEHLTEAQRRAYIIADNRLAENAGWDADMLKLSSCPASCPATGFPGTPESGRSIDTPESGRSIDMTIPFLLRSERHKRGMKPLCLTLWAFVI